VQEAKSNQTALADSVYRKQSHALTVRCQATVINKHSPSMNLHRSVYDHIFPTGWAISAERYTVVLAIIIIQRGREGVEWVSTLESPDILRNLAHSLRRDGKFYGLHMAPPINYFCFFLHSCTNNYLTHVHHLPVCEWTELDFLAERVDCLVESNLNSHPLPLHPRRPV